MGRDGCADDMAIELALALAGTDVKEAPSVVHGRPCASEGVKISGVRKKSEWIEDGLISPGEVYRFSWPGSLHRDCVVLPRPNRQQCKLERCCTGAQWLYLLLWWALRSLTLSSFRPRPLPQRRFLLCNARLYRFNVVPKSGP